MKLHRRDNKMTDLSSGQVDVVAAPSPPPCPVRVSAKGLGYEVERGFVTVQRFCKMSPCNFSSWTENFTGFPVFWLLVSAAETRPAPSPPDGGRATSMMHNPYTPSLPCAVWPPSGSAVVGVGREHINPGPHFRRRAALEVVMRS